MCRWPRSNAREYTSARYQSDIQPTYILSDKPYIEVFDLKKTRPQKLHRLNEKDLFLDNLGSVAKHKNTEKKTLDIYRFPSSK